MSAGGEAYADALSPSMWPVVSALESLMLIVMYIVDWTACWAVADIIYSDGAAGCRTIGVCGPYMEAIWR